MRSIAIVFFLTIPIISSVFAQEVAAVQKGSDYFPSKPGMRWIMDMQTPEGKQLSMYTLYSIDANLPSRSVQIPIRQETYLYGSLGTVLTKIYRIMDDGSVSLTKTLGGLGNQFSPQSQLILPENIVVGAKWVSIVPNDYIQKRTLLQFVEKVSLPSGAIYADAILIKLELLDGPNTVVATFYEYYAAGAGEIGLKNSEGRWMQYRRD